VLLVAFIQSVNIPFVLAQEPEPRLPKLGPFLGPGDTDPYVAAYQEQESNWGSSFSSTQKVRITVSFPNTPPAGQTIQDVIPEGNYIAGGMFLQGQDDEVDNHDYGWVASLSLDHDGIFQYNMAFYETYEGFAPFYDIVGQTYWIIWRKAIVLYGVNPSTPITLTMQWNGGFVEWLYTIGQNSYLAGLYNVYAYRSSIQRQFYIGVVWGYFFWIYYFQFGIYSETEIMNTGWTVRLEDPQYYTADNRWKYVREAKSVQGEWSYLDNWWRWGGDIYGSPIEVPYGACARYYGTNGEGGLSEGFAIEFYWKWGDLLQGGWTLWNNPPTEPEPPAKPSGPTYVYKGYTYYYSTVTLDPNDDNVYYWFFWGDNTDNIIGPYLSGVTATASHSWSSTGYFWIYVLAQDSTGRWSWWSPGLQVYVAEYTGGGGGGGCVAEGTLITMADGSVKAVELIKVGDHVLGFDPSTDSYATQNVIAVTKTRVKLIENLNDGALRLTPTHQPIYIRNSTYEGWVQDPATIHVGWEIFDAKTRTWVTVMGITYEERNAWVYDLITDGYQTYLANSFLLMDKGHGHK